MRESPYTGLMPFTEDQAPFFFGRDAEREIITANLMAARLTLLYGPSGVGKSSVLNAGVAHHLRLTARDSIARRGKPEFAIVLFRSWRDDPLAGLEHAIEREVGGPAAGATFADRLNGWAERIDGDMLIVLDQVEEYFLYHPNEDGNGTFAVEFPRAVNRADLRVSFLVSMREDSIAKLDFFKGRIPNLFDNYLRIDHLERDQARDAIVKPLEVYNRLQEDERGHVTIEPQLVEQVLDQVTAGRVNIAESGRGRLGDKDTAVRHTKIETPYLQLVMTRLWQEEESVKSPVLRAETLRRLGGADHIVATHLDAAMGALTADERDAAAKIFQYLVTPSRTKIALGVEDLAEYAGTGRAKLQTLLVKLSSGESRILSPVAPAPDQPARERYQIFHDVLAAAVLEWRTRYVKLAEQKAAEAIAEEERRKAEKEARSAAKLRKLLALVGALLIVAAAAAWVAWRQTGKAENALQNAELSRLKADQARAEADAANHDAENRRLDLLAANARTTAAEEETASLRLRTQAAEARIAGRTDQAAKLAQQATVAATSAAKKREDSARLVVEAKKEATAADAALAQAKQVSQQIAAYPRDSAASKPPGATANPPGAGPPPTVTPAPPEEPRPTVTPPPPVAAPSSGGAGPTATPTPRGVTPPTPPPTAPITAPAAGGDYREAYRKAIDAKNRKRWDEAARLFQASIALRGTDTGERINISGFGNIEPYLPHYYLGLSLKNLGNCKGALEAWDLSERDSAIQKTNLYKPLQQNRQECQALAGPEAR